MVIRSRSSNEQWDVTMTLAIGAVVGVSVTWMTTTWIAYYNQQQTRQQRNDHAAAASSSSSSSWTTTTTSPRTTAGGTGATTTTNTTTTTTATSLPFEIRQEQLSRHALYFGQDGLQRVTQSSIVVVGVGGVGSHCGHMLARGGIGHLRFIDFDQVTLSSLNRHACATLADVGISKVTCLQRFCQAICPDPQHLHIEAIPEMYNAETGHRLLQYNTSTITTTTNREWDIVVDCIDDVPTKARLIADALQKGVRVLSCMGAGGKSDVTRLHVSDLRTASRDPLASKLRQSLKRIMAMEEDEDNDDDNSNNTKKKKKDNSSLSYLDDMSRLAVIYSSEKTQVKLADFTQDQLASDGGVSQYGAVEGMRIRIVPVLGTMPAIMGQALAAVALQTLAHGPASLQPVTGERVSKNVRNKLFQRLKTREDKFYKRMIAENSQQQGQGEDKALDEAGGRRVGEAWIGPLQIDQDDCEYMLEVWHNRCAVTGARLGTILELSRWDTSKPGTCDNIVLLASHALEAFEKTGPAGLDPAVRQRIEARLSTCRVDAQAEQILPNY